MFVRNMRLGGPSLETVPCGGLPTLTRPRTRGTNDADAEPRPGPGRRAKRDDVAAEIAEPARAC